MTSRNKGSVSYALDGLKAGEDVDAAARKLSTSRMNDVDASSRNRLGHIPFGYYCEN
jgi:hypothetical protein